SKQLCNNYVILTYTTLFRSQWIRSPCCHALWGRLRPFMKPHSFKRCCWLCWPVSPARSGTMQHPVFAYVNARSTPAWACHTVRTHSSRKPLGASRPPPFLSKLPPCMLLPPWTAHLMPPSPPEQSVQNTTANYRLRCLRPRSRLNRHKSPCPRRRC